VNITRVTVIVIFFSRAI